MKTRSGSWVVVVASCALAACEPAECVEGGDRLCVPVQEEDQDFLGMTSLDNEDESAENQGQSDGTNGQARSALGSFCKKTGYGWTDEADSDFFVDFDCQATNGRVRSFAFPAYWVALKASGKDLVILKRGAGRHRVIMGLTGIKSALGGTNWDEWVLSTWITLWIDPSTKGSW